MLTKLNRRRIERFLALFIIISSIFFAFFIILWPSNNQSNTEIKVMTWNISGAVGTDEIFDLERAIDVIKENDPDIIGLQEVDDNVDVSKIADELNMDYYYAEAGDTNEGNAILSKYDIDEVNVVNLPLIDGERPRILINAKITIHKNKWDFYVAHFSRYDKPIDHVNQAKFVSSYISENSYSKVVLMGDLNFQPESLSYYELMYGYEIKFKDTYACTNSDSGYTFRSNNRFKRIDYIFCSFDLSPQKSKVICSEASDHCAVLTKFTITTK